MRSRGFEAPAAGYHEIRNGPDLESAIRRVVDLTRSFLAGMIATGTATEEEVDIDTLAERLRADTGRVGRVSLWPTVVGAFATKPA